MSHLRVDPRKVQHVEMRDGTRYPVGRNGIVHVNEPHHEDELRRFGAPDEGATGWVDNMRVGYVAAKGKRCACGFEAWSWTRTCPRCGADL